MGFSSFKIEDLKSLYFFALKEWLNICVFTAGNWL
jgi:hypothetical protein